MLAIARTPDAPPLAAFGQLSEKPRQGFAILASTLRPGFGLANSFTAIGVGRSVAPETRRATETGRFLSPDWSSSSEAVPYADFANPQTLNLYSYVRNNPLSWRDADGHYGGCSDTPELCASIRDAIHGGGDSGEVLQAGQQALKPLSAASEQAILNSPLTGEQAVAFENATTSAAQRALVDPNILVGLGSKESNIDPTLVTSSSAGPARGIFQITPGQQTFLKLTNDQVFSVTGAVPAVAGYFANYTKLFSDRKGADVGGDLAIASWTMGVQHTLNVFNKEGMPAVRATSLGDPQNHKVGSDYIDVIDGFQ